MKINEVKLSNFKCFSNEKIKLNKDYTVLLGVNGAGKSTVLEGIAIALGAYLSGFDGINSNSITAMDAHKVTSKMGSVMQSQSQYPVEISANGNVCGREINWSRSLTGVKNRTTIVDAKEIIQIGKNKDSKIREGDDSVLLPIVAYYGTGRLWTKRRNSASKSIKSNMNRQRGYLDTLDSDINENLLIYWFKQMTGVELEENRKIPELEAVRAAMIHCYRSSNPNFTDINIAYKNKEDAIIIKTTYDNGLTEYLPLSSLSDGIKSVMYLVADIAYRMAILNAPLLDDVLKTSGVVLIDEIDMHLHPTWQKKIIKDLTTIFPNVQFVFATHSPSVIANVPREKILLLDNYKIESNSIYTYGRNVDDILKDIMGVDVRPEEVKELIKEFNDAIDDGDLLEARRKLNVMEELLGMADQEVIRAQINLDFEEE